MNRYPLWKYVVIGVALVLGLLYTVPTFFGTTQAVQVSAAKATVKVEANVKDKVAQVLAAQNIPYTGLYFEQTAQGLGMVKVRINGVDAQAKAKQALDTALNTDPKAPAYTLASSTVSAAPDWMSALGAKPVSLGLDLRGGVHFLLQVQMSEAVQKKLDAMQTGFATALKDKNITPTATEKTGEQIVLSFDTPAAVEQARAVISSDPAALSYSIEPAGNQLKIGLTAQAVTEVKNQAIKQNIEIKPCTSML